MSSPCRLLYWMAAGFLLCTWEVPIRSWGMQFTSDENDGHERFGVEDGSHPSYGAQHEERIPYAVENDNDCVGPANSSAPVGLQGYRRYFANDSLIGRPVPCTRDDKICFRYNLIFDPISDRCKALWETCGEEKSLTVVDRTELKLGSGRVVSSCSENDGRCPGYLMAYDGLCYRKEIVRDVICGCNAVPTRHILGGVECRARPMPPINVQQPEKDGSCVIPDLNHPDPRRSKLLDDPFQIPSRTELNCRSNQAACFSEGKVFVEGYQGCHSLLEQGPCAEDHVVALDRQAKESEGRAEGTCVDVRGGCPKGYKRMLFDGECHEDREITILAPGDIVVDEFGRHFVSEWRAGKFLNAAFDGNHTCIIQILLPTSPPVFPLDPPCGSDNSGKCKLFEVLSDPPKPDFDDRK